MIRETNLLAGLRAAAAAPLPNAEPVDRGGKNGPVSSIAKDGQAQKMIQVPAVNGLPFDPANQFAGTWANLQGFIIGMNMSPGAILKATNPFIEREDGSDEEEIDPETGEPKSESAKERPSSGTFKHYAMNEDPFDESLHYRF